MPLLESLDILLAGWHRLEAAKLLGWETIKAEVFEGDELECELVEIDENLTNHDLTVLEQSIQLKRRNEILEEMGKRAKASPGTNQYTEVGESDSPTKTTEDIAKEAGLSKRVTQQRIQIARDLSAEVKELIGDTPIADSTTQLLDLARMKPDEQIEVAKQAVAGETTVADVKRKKNRDKRIGAILENAKDVEPINSIGKFPVIYADPPWRYEHPISDSRKIENQYPTQTDDEICGLEVSKITTENAVLFLWATSPMLKRGLRVMESWGFEYRTSMVWVKPSIGPGYWVRQRHEFLLIGVKGSIPTPEGGDKPDSVIEAPRQEHSKKPEVVYELIEKMYPELPKVELYSRQPREGWKAWGYEA